jgi:hypothetical protein
MTPENQASALSAITRLARAVREDRQTATIWRELDRSLEDVFGRTLFTVLAYDETSNRLGRVYSNRPDISPVGGVKRVMQSRWTEQVILRGDIFRGSTREDIRAVFSEYERLWSAGCESVLNIPVRKNGITMGTLNLLDEERRYDHADTGLALVFAQLVVPAMEASVRSVQAFGDAGQVDQV